MKKLNICIAAVMIFCVLAVGCSNGKTESKQSSSNPIGNVSISQEEQNPVYISEDVVVDTKYGVLYYPEQWREFVKTEQESKDDAIFVTFTAEINEKTYPLFGVTIGGNGENPAGEITDSEGTKRNVYIYVEEIQEDPSLTEGEQNRLYAMQEDLNYLIDNLK